MASIHHPGRHNVTAAAPTNPLPAEPVEAPPAPQTDPAVKADSNEAT